jgi:hypothetical protein
MPEKIWYTKMIRKDEDQTDDTLPLSSVEAKETPQSLVGRRQWMSDLKTQLEMSSQAATTCGRMNRR